MSTATKDKASKAAPKAAKAPKAAPQASGMGLGDIGDLSSLLDGGAAAPSGVVAVISLDLIDEDPNQPRTKDNPGFSPESLAELAETIKARGVKSPISIRDNPDAPGRYLINHGARRFLGSKLAGKTTIPYVLDNDYLSVDQLIENLQRVDNTPMEIARFIERLMKDQGMNKSEVAKALGRSPAFVTQHTALLSLPEPIQEAFDQGRVRDVTLISDLVTAWKKNPDDVEAWLAQDEQEITRSSVKLLREFLEEKNKPRDPNTVDAFTDKTDAEHGGDQRGGSGSDGGQDDGEQGGQDATGKDKGEEKPEDPTKLKKAIIQVQYKERPARLMLNRRPPCDGFAWLKYEDDGQEIEASLAAVTITAIIEG